jgi:hypothetical protein
MTISFRRSFHVALHYHILSHLDLGPDAASLYVPGRAAPGWAEALRQAYIAAPEESLALQVLPLCSRDLPGMLAALRRWNSDLSRQFARVLELENPLQRENWLARAPAARRRMAEAEAEVGAVLSQLRAGLWPRPGQPAPPLYILDAPALTRHGRATSVGGQRYCAVSLDESFAHVLFQVFHEEVHAACDNEIDVDGGSRTTRPGTPGFDIHHALETHALQRGREVIERHAPGFLANYDRWVARFG